MCHINLALALAGFVRSCRRLKAKLMFTTLYKRISIYSSGLTNNGEQYYLCDELKLSGEQGNREHMHNLPV